MRRALLLGVVLAVLLPAAPARAASVAIFYYPWYGTPKLDGSYLHWSQSGHEPPGDIASSFYPAAGLYSSRNPRVLARQMDDMALAGVDTVIVSWWGWGSTEDILLPQIIIAAKRAHLKVAVHLEPYLGRTTRSIATDIEHLKTLGVSDYYVYDASGISLSDWALFRLSRPNGVRMFAETRFVGWAWSAGFDGVYTYDVFSLSGSFFGRYCAQASAVGLLCMPSIGPGYDSSGSTDFPDVKPRARGAMYDAMWKAVIRAMPNGITITSYNEWHEGTQIEPARVQYGYEDYERAWGLRGRAARNAYLCRTAQWSAIFRAVSSGSLAKVHTPTAAPLCAGR
jgi:hypothetical protein